MKKIMILVLLIFLTGCNLFNDISSYKDSITLTPDDRLLEYLPYKEYPIFTLDFSGSLNFTKNRQGNYECIFSQNDDFIVSSLIKKLINEYTEKNRVSIVVISSIEEYETWMNRRDEKEDKKIYIKIKDHIIRNEICYITLENGLQLTISYSTFIDDNNISYYRWQKTESIRMILHYPLMVTKINDKRAFLFIALPNQVRLKFDITTKKFDLLLNDDKFMNIEYYTYDYVNSFEEDYLNYKSYYINNFNGRMINEEFIYTYLGYDFKITFNSNNFTIERY